LIFFYLGPVFTLRDNNKVLVLLKNIYNSLEHLRPVRPGGHIHLKSNCPVAKHVPPNKQTLGPHARNIFSIKTQHRDEMKMLIII